MTSEEQDKGIIESIYNPINTLKSVFIKFLDGKSKIKEYADRGIKRSLDADDEDSDFKVLSSDVSKKTALDFLNSRSGRVPDEESNKKRRRSDYSGKCLDNPGQRELNYKTAIPSSSLDQTKKHTSELCLNESYPLNSVLDPLSGVKFVKIFSSKNSSVQSLSTEKDNKLCYVIRDNSNNPNEPQSLSANTGSQKPSSRINFFYSSLQEIDNVKQNQIGKTDMQEITNLLNDRNEPPGTRTLLGIVRYPCYVKLPKGKSLSPVSKSRISKGIYIEKLTKKAESSSSAACNQFENSQRSSIENLNKCGSSGTVKETLSSVALTVENSETKTTYFPLDSRTFDTDLQKANDQDFQVNKEEATSKTVCSRCALKSLGKTGDDCCTYCQKKSKSNLNCCCSFCTISGIVNEAKEYLMMRLDVAEKTAMVAKMEVLQEARPERRDETETFKSPNIIHTSNTVSENISMKPIRPKITETCIATKIQQKRKGELPDDLVKTRKMKRK